MVISCGQLEMWLQQTVTLLQYNIATASSFVVFGLVCFLHTLPEHNDCIFVS